MTGGCPSMTGPEQSLSEPAPPLRRRRPAGLPHRITNSLTALRVVLLVKDITSSLAKALPGPLSPEIPPTPSNFRSFPPAHHPPRWPPRSGPHPLAPTPQHPTLTPARFLLPARHAHPQHPTLLTTPPLTTPPSPQARHTPARHNLPGNPRTRPTPADRHRRRSHPGTQSPSPTGTADVATTGHSHPGHRHYRRSRPGHSATQSTSTAAMATQHETRTRPPAPPGVATRDIAVVTTPRKPSPPILP